MQGDFIDILSKIKVDQLLKLETKYQQLLQQNSSPDVLAQAQ